MKPFCPLVAPLSSLEGIGDHLSVKLSKLTDSRVIDLLYHLPCALEIWKPIQRIHEARPSDKVSIVLEVLEHIPPQGHKRVYKVVCTDGHIFINLVFFKAYATGLLKLLPYGEKRLVCGTLEQNEFGHYIAHPTHIGKPEDIKNWTGPIPIYPLTAGITGKILQKSIGHALRKIEPMKEWIPANIMIEKKWPAFKEALWQAHHPIKERDLLPSAQARERLAFDELFAHQLHLALVKSRYKKIPAPVLQPMAQDTVLQTLPFRLTQNQEKVLAEIHNDFVSGYQMRRLLQGDVGSGKTIVALLSLLTAIQNGYQGALLAPTEILATQHFETCKKFLKDTSVSVELFTADTLGKKRKEKLEMLTLGHTQLAIGTHALLEDTIAFKNLGCIVIDEQHRFGVRQRLKLSQKGHHPHVLIMTATPIPRSLAWTRYGDLSLSLLVEKPAGRKSIQTAVMPLDKIQEVYDGLKRVLEKDEKIFWVCPLIEESEKLDIGPARTRFESLCAQFPKQVAFIHGRMESKERESILTQFRAGAMKILVATTVIEVGLHIGEATVMVIENAERFGLSQLHQLRGRVGRSNKDSFCILLYASTAGKIAQQRLSVMRATEDGFLIAEEDLRMRGSGDLPGTKQSGLPSFKVADITCQTDLVQKAWQAATQLLKEDPLLEYPQGKCTRELLRLFKK